MNTIRTVWPLGLKWDAFGIRLMPVLSPDLESVHRGVLFYFKCPAATLPDLKDCRLPNVHESRSEFSRTPIQKDPRLNVRMRGVREFSNVLK